MPRKLSQPRPQSLPELIEFYLDTCEEAKALYDEADDLLLKISRKMKRNDQVKISGNRVATLVNQFRGKTVVWGHGSVRKWKLETFKASSATA